LKFLKKQSKREISGFDRVLRMEMENRFHCNFSLEIFANELDADFKKKRVVKHSTN
jgi:hypothetical protein